MCTGIGNADELANAIKQIDVNTFKQVHGLNARTYFEKHFAKKMLMDEIDRYYSEDLIRQY